MSKSDSALAALMVLAILSSFLFTLALVGARPFGIWPPKPTSGNSTVLPPPFTVATPLAILQSGAFVLAPVSWSLVVGAWIWRGRMKSNWIRLGLTKDTFNLLIKMRGSKTRIGMIRALTVPKDRYQLAKELGLDWTTVDYHIRVLLENGLVHEQSAYGNVKMYELTSIGSTLLKVLDETDSGRSPNS
ncbi:MAG: winged helix-turn-helix transcriptional regulator [Nitrososphaerota archaeon]|nr:winged helix-turn-helix transcriptional regulator [Nitrososphaerota archaeon]